MHTHNVYDFTIIHTGQYCGNVRSGVITIIYDFNVDPKMFLELILLFLLSYKGGLKMLKMFNFSVRKPRKLGAAVCVLV